MDASPAAASCADVAASFSSSSPSPSGTARSTSSAPFPFIGEALSYWLDLSRLITSVNVVSSTDAPNISSVTSFSCYALHGILLFCGIKQHRVQQTVDHMIAHTLATAFAVSDDNAVATASSDVLPRVMCDKPSHNNGVLDTSSWIETPSPPSAQPVSLAAFVRDWVLLSSNPAAASLNPDTPPAQEHHRRYCLQVPSAVWDRTIIKVLGNELRGQMICLRPLLRWNMACAQQRRQVPVVIFMGGTSGSGKSTLARLVANQLRIANVVSTDTVRQVLRSRLRGREKEHPELFVSTYEAYKALNSDAPAPSSDPSRDPVIQGYEAQCTLILRALDGMLTRLLARRESVVVEGVHLLPSYLAAKRAELLVRRVICVPVLVQIPKADGHLERFCVRSRGMSLQSNNNKYIASFQAIRAIQSHLVTAVEAAALPVLVMTNTNIDKSFLVLHHAVLETMEHTALHGWPADTTVSAQVPLTALAFTATKQKLVAVVRQRRSRGAGTAVEEARNNNSTVDPRRGGTNSAAAAFLHYRSPPEVSVSASNGSSNGGVVSLPHGSATTVASRARSAELINTTQRHLLNQNWRCTYAPPLHSSSAVLKPVRSAESPRDTLNHTVADRQQRTTQEESHEADFSSASCTPSPPGTSPSSVLEGRWGVPEGTDDDKPLGSTEKGDADKAAVPRQSSATGVIQQSSFVGQLRVGDTEELFDEADVPSLLGS